jgi:DNA polymerase-3 subunit alpha
MIPFTHLHVHSQYSILDGAASIKGLVSKAKNDGSGLKNFGTPVKRKA